MGEIADMMLDGTLCEGCGCFIDFDGGDGFPRYCSDQCARDRGRDDLVEDVVLPDGRRLDTPNPKKTNCPHCKRRVKVAGLADHVRDVHPDIQP